VIGAIGGTRLNVKRGYGTAFSVAENPISEGSHWVNGAATGLDWNNLRVQTIGGAPLAHGTQSGVSGIYDDSVAILSGAWPKDQRVVAKVRTVNQSSTAFCEVELWVHGTITAHSITGYECVFRCTSDGSQYLGITRWNGPIGDFTQVDPGGATGPGLVDGDIIMAEIVGSTITTYINGVQVCQATDSTYRTGNPGMGHWMRTNGAVGVAVTDHGFRTFTAMAI
jgi:hypothetical protein